MFDNDNDAVEMDTKGPPLSPRSQQSFHSSPRGSPQGGDGNVSPRSPRRKQSFGAAQNAQLLGLGAAVRAPGSVPLLGDEDEDEWGPLELWKPGDNAYLVTNEDKIHAAMEAAELPSPSSELLQHCGEVATVTVVTAEQNLEVVFGEDTTVFMLPPSAVKKTLMLPLEKPAEMTVEDIGLQIRHSEFGGLQVIGTTEGEDAWKAGIGSHPGWWITHVGKAFVMTEEDFTDAEGTSIRLEKRVTLPYTFASSTLEDKIERAILSSDLRIYLIFVALFVVFFILDRDVEASYYITQNMRAAVFGNEIPFFYPDDSGIGCKAGEPEILKWEKTYRDLANVWDWNVWTVTMALPSLWATSQFGPAVSSNILLGGVRFRTIRTRSDSCTVNPDIIPSYLLSEQKCYGAYSSGAESAGRIGGESMDYLATFNPRETTGIWGETPQYRTCGETDPDGSWVPPLTSGLVDTYHCGGYVFEIPFHRNGTNGLEVLPVETAVEMYKNWACKGWVDDYATRLVALELYEYSPTFDTFLSVKIFFEVAAGGAWLPLDQYRTFSIWSPNKKGQLALDIIFLMFILYYVGDFIADARRQRRRNRKLLRHFMSPWVILEFLNLTLFLISFGFRFAWYTVSNSTNVTVDEMNRQRVYPVVLDRIEWLFMMQVYFNSCSMCIFGIFKRVTKDESNNTQKTND